MWGKLSQKFRALSRREPREYIFEPVTHRLTSHPILPQGLMSSIAPAYEEVLAKEKEEQKPQESQE
ncbi:MAG: hypothetical protein C0619_07070 [Desulfuromonas sp.]|nr:MAG: hypothetical protein C0619_07070 [Desulfuromonas sp.]